MIERIGADVQNAWAHFDLKVFERDVLVDLDRSSLIERSWLITNAMHDQFPASFCKCAPILLELIDEAGRRAHIDVRKGFYFMPFGNFVAAHGLAHFELSMELLKALTKRFTAEFAIRPFLENHQAQTLAQLYEWTEDSDEHVRRLVSEGSRPRLPWGTRLRAFQKDPTPVIGLLEKLKADGSLYVRRSVANNLNDIAKDHPGLVIELLKKWSGTQDEGTHWIIKHASRSLVKAGNSDALALLGFDPKVQVKLSELKVPPNVLMGGEVEFSFKVQSRERTSKELMVDFVVLYMKGNGKQAPKVFKLAKCTLEAGEIRTFSKKISFKPISTRKFHKGKHSIEIQVNGQRHGWVDFTLQ